MLSAGREKCADLPGLRLLTADASSLPFDDASLDCVASVRFLNLFPSALRLPFLGEMRRVSRRFLLAESRYSRELAWWRPLAAAISPRVRDHYEFDKAFWADMAAAGWKVHKLHHFKSRGLVSSTRLVAMFEKA